MSKFGIIDIVVKSMEDVEKYKNYTGDQKKQIVINSVKQIITDGAYDKYSDFIPILIDFIIAISKNKYSIDLNKIKKCFSCIS